MLSQLITGKLPSGVDNCDLVQESSERPKEAAIATGDKVQTPAKKIVIMALFQPLKRSVL